MIRALIKGLTQKQYQAEGTVWEEGGDEVAGRHGMGFVDLLHLIIFPWYSSYTLNMLLLTSSIMPCMINSSLYNREWKSPWQNLFVFPIHTFEDKRGKKS